MYFLSEVLPCYSADAIELLKHPHELLCFHIGLGAFGCLALMLEAQVLSEVQEVLSIDWRPIVAAHDHWYSKR